MQHLVFEVGDVDSGHVFEDVIGVLVLDLFVRQVDGVCEPVAHGLNDKKMVEMAAFEERGFLRWELGHIGDYP